MRRWLRRWRCKHEMTRCVHGDEIVARGYRRVACLECDASLPWPLPAFCTMTGQLHHHLADGGEREPVRGW